MAETVSQRDLGRAGKQASTKVTDEGIKLEPGLCWNLKQVQSSSAIIVSQ